MLLGGPAEFADDGVVDTNLVIFNVVAVNFDGGLIVFVGEGEVLRRQGF